MALSCPNIMDNFIDVLRNKSIHVVGVTGAEGSSILRFLVKHKIDKITAHDFNPINKLEKSFQLWHKGLATIKRENLYKQFSSDLGKTTLCAGEEYLKYIDKADLIFVPQSWRLYKDINKPLSRVSGKIPFYSLTRLYLDFAPARIIAVTGTVGKGSTANILYQLLKKSLFDGRRVYFAGNETWMVQLADKLDEMTKDDILILEISHRQLQDGFNRAPNIVVITNVFPNHLDEVGWEEYKNLKLSLITKQTGSDISILNYDIPQLRLKDKLNSKVIYFSGKYQEMNTKNIQRVYSEIMSMKSDHYLANLLAGFAIIDVLGINIEQIISFLPQVKPLPARLELVQTVQGIKIYNDIKSTTPWGTLAALAKLGKDTILICGGRMKGIDYTQLAQTINRSVKRIIILKSELSEQLSGLMPDNNYSVTDNLKHALELAFRQTKTGDNILISPAAGFFYRDFIRGKKSIRQLIISLPPKEQA